MRGIEAKAKSGKGEDIEVGVSVHEAPQMLSAARWVRRQKSVSLLLSPLVLGDERGAGRGEGAATGVRSAWGEDPDLLGIHSLSSGRPAVQPHFQVG